MSRKLLIPAVAVAAMAVLAGAGAYAYFFSGLRTSPTALGLSSPSPTSSATASTTAGGAGTWQVASGSLVGYRVTEKFAGQSSTHEAVARTGEVTGQITISQSGSTYRLTGARTTAQLAGSIVTNMTDFGISPPALPITVVQPTVTIEFQLNLTPSA